MSNRKSPPSSPASGSASPSGKRRASGLKPRKLVDVTSHYQGQERSARGYLVVEYPVPQKCAAMYYPEANVLVPIGSTEPLSNCPTFKHTVISVKPARANHQSLNYRGGGPTMSIVIEERKPLPPFTFETAVQKVRLAEDGWNSRDPEKVALAYSVDSRWRNRNEFVVGREAIIGLLQRKWDRERDYRLIKELWTHGENRIAVRFAYEWRDTQGNWFRSYGNENWEFDEHGLMTNRHASINDLVIREDDRKFYWPLGRRPDAHPGLSSFGF